MRLADLNIDEAVYINTLKRPHTLTVEYEAALSEPLSAGATLHHTMVGFVETAIPDRDGHPINCKVVLSVVVNDNSHSAVIHGISGQAFGISIMSIAVDALAASVNPRFLHETAYDGGAMTDAAIIQSYGGPGRCLFHVRGQGHEDMFKLAHRLAQVDKWTGMPRRHGQGTRPDFIPPSTYGLDVEDILALAELKDSPVPVILDIVRSLLANLGTSLASFKLAFSNSLHVGRHDKIWVSEDCDQLALLQQFGVTAVSSDIMLLKSLLSSICDITMDVGSSAHMPYVTVSNQHLYTLFYPLSHGNVVLDQTRLVPEIVLVPATSLLVTSVYNTVDTNGFSCIQRLQNNFRDPLQGPLRGTISLGAQVSLLKLDTAELRSSTVSVCIHGTWWSLDNLISVAIKRIDSAFAAPKKPTHSAYAFVTPYFVLLFALGDNYAADKRIRVYLHDTGRRSLLIKGFKNLRNHMLSQGKSAQLLNFIFHSTGVARESLQLPNR
jgi:hypothetical protein